MTEKSLKVTTSLEDYLETIYFLQERTDSVRITDIASKLKISKPSVNRAINSLKDKGLINHEHYGLVTLTKNGIEIAKSVAKRHFVLKSFLVEVLGVNEEVAEAEACKIEHILSTDTISKIEGFMSSKPFSR